MYWIVGVLGLLLIAAPFGLGFRDLTNEVQAMAMWTSVILGILVVLAAAYKAIAHDAGRWEYWVAGVVGVLAIIAPFVLGFSTITMALWALLAVGIILVLLDGYEVFVHPGTGQTA